MMWPWQSIFWHRWALNEPPLVLLVCTEHSLLNETPLGIRSFFYPSVIVRTWRGFFKCLLSIAYIKKWTKYNYLMISIIISKWTDMYLSINLMPQKLLNTLPTPSSNVTPVPGLLNLHTTYILGWVILCCGAVLCIVRRSSRFLASTH